MTKINKEKKLPLNNLNIYCCHRHNVIVTAQITFNDKH